MYGSLHGTVTGRLDQRILVEVSGIGYWVHTGTWHPTGEVTCYLHHVVREDASDLYGFERLQELAFFERLIGISGIGPKAALALLSLGSADRLGQAILNKDVTFLTSAPGIGQKAAQKIILELHGKMDNMDELLGDDNEGGELMAALTGLGYKPHEVRPLIAKMPAELTTVDAQLKWMLQQS
ncbi:MAG: Holliday junction branch migration protein RuvA [bacterium]